MRMRLLEGLLFSSGWLILGVVAGLSVWWGYPVYGFAVVTLVGMLAAILEFKSLEMPLGMVLSAIVGGLLMDKTCWGLVFPWSMAGFMTSSLISSRFERRMANANPGSHGTGTASQ